MSRPGPVAPAGGQWLRVYNLDGSFPNVPSIGDEGEYWCDALTTVLPLTGRPPSTFAIGRVGIVSSMSRCRFGPNNRFTNWDNQNYPVYAVICLVGGAPVGEAIPSRLSQCVNIHDNDFRDVQHRRLWPCGEPGLFGFPPSFPDIDDCTLVPILTGWAVWGLLTIRNNSFGTVLEPVLPYAARRSVNRVSIGSTNMSANEYFIAVGDYHLDEMGTPSLEVTGNVNELGRQLAPQYQTTS